MIGFLFFCCVVDVLGDADAVGCETMRCFPGLDEGLMPRGLDDGPDEMYAIDFGSGGGDALWWFVKLLEGLRDAYKDQVDSMGFGGKGCLLPRGSAFDCICRGFRGIECSFGSVFTVVKCATVRDGDIRAATGCVTETILLSATLGVEDEESPPLDRSAARGELGCCRALDERGNLFVPLGIWFGLKEVEDGDDCSIGDNDTAF